MRKHRAKDPLLREQSAIGIRKACNLAIARKLEDLIHSDDTIPLRDFKCHIIFNDHQKIEHLKKYLCRTYLKNTKSGSSILANYLGVTVQTINNWMHDVLIPAEMAKLLHDKMAIDLHELRPDLFDKKM